MHAFKDNYITLYRFRQGGGRRLWLALKLQAVLATNRATSTKQSRLQRLIATP